ncbi:uncharacterized protein LOC132257394 [Phlebotomus argentipes]|uniref:uncharacterized protein LOC132257394 n=1 Tax=Phlebotomus argentipes TaxID=94469 RepID=UPI0028936878|nr:uncharacterized protein LOC132257394 [Phlebotomus argentipes]
MDKNRTSKLSPFSALKYSSPVVALNRIDVSLPPSEAEVEGAPGPRTRSQTAANRQTRRPDETNRQKPFIEYKTRRHNPRSRREDANSDPRQQKDSQLSVKDTFRFELKNSPKTRSENRTARNDSWMNSNSGRRDSIFPRNSPRRYDLDLFDANKPPPPLFKSPRRTNNSSNISQPFPLMSIDFSKPPPTSGFRMELPNSTMEAQSKSAENSWEKLEEIRKKDQEMIRDFLKQRGYIEGCETSANKRKSVDEEMDVDEPKMTLELAQAILGQCISKVGKISKLTHVMRNNVDIIENYEWQLKNQQLNILRAEIIETLQPLLNPSAIGVLQGRLKKRKAKMLWLHKRSAVFRSRKQMEKERRARTKAFVDYWNEKWQELDNENRDKEVEKKLATQLLQDVTKRISETREIISIFGQLKVLSLARLVADGQNGDEGFNKKMDELQAVWEDLLLEYQEEKITLDTMIDRRTSNAPLPPKPASLESQWLQTIFGTESIYDDGNQYLLAQRDLPCFLQIRGIWDRFLVPLNAPRDVGSSIPIFWSLPSSRPTTAWRQFQRRD